MMTEEIIKTGEQIVQGLENLSVSIFTLHLNSCLQRLSGVVLTFNQCLDRSASLETKPWSFGDEHVQSVVE